MTSAPVTKQEQEEATREVSKVAPGVLRMQLPIQFTGLGHVNMYGFVDPRGIAVIDPGLPGGGSWKAIEDRLRRAGVRIRDVHTVLVSHGHPDHFGGAGRLAKEAGAKLITHQDFAVPWFPETFPDIVELDVPDGPDDLVARGGAGDLLRWERQTPWSPKAYRPGLRDRVTMGAVRLGSRRIVAPVPTQRLGDGDVVRLAGREWFAVHTPGHTADHLCLHDPEEGVLLTGDHVLPSITPHISGVGAGPDPLDDCVRALGRRPASWWKSDLRRGGS